MYRAISCLLLLAIFVGCEARSQVALDKITDRIDKMLGQLDVKRKKIDNELKALKGSLSTINEKKHSAQVKLEIFQKDVKSLENEVARLKDGIALLRPHLGTEEPVKIKSKEYSPEEISTSLSKLADTLEEKNRALGNLEGSVGAFERARNLLAMQEDQGNKLVKSLEQTLKEIDAKKSAAMAMKEAGSLAGDQSVTDKFSKLQGEVDDLFVDVETAMRVEEEKISKFVDSQSDVVSGVLDGLKDDDDLAARLDEMLGKESENSSTDDDK